MAYNYTRSGNAIAKNAKIQGPQFIVNQGFSFIGQQTEIHGERNQGKPIISWGKYVVLDNQCSISPSQKPGTESFMPLRIGNHVYIGTKSKIEASSIGSHVIIGSNCKVGARAVIHDCTVVPDNSEIPPGEIVGPMTKFGPEIEELPESAEEAIDWFCEMKSKGIRTPVPF